MHNSQFILSPRKVTLVWCEDGKTDRKTLSLLKHIHTHTALSNKPLWTLHTSAHTHIHKLLHWMFCATNVSIQKWINREKEKERTKISTIKYEKGTHQEEHGVNKITTLIQDSIVKSAFVFLFYFVLFLFVSPLRKLSKSGSFRPVLSPSWTQTHIYI